MRRGVTVAILTAALHLMAPLSLPADEPACEGLSIPQDCPYPPDATGNCGCDLFENFEDYRLGEIPQADPADPLDPVSNAWAGWELDPDVLGEIDDARDHTTGTGQSLRIDEGDDQVRWFVGRGLRDDDFGYDADVGIYWIFEGQVFIPEGHTGDHLLILNSHYTRFPNDPDSVLATDWHVQIEMNSLRGKVWDSLPPRGTSPPPEESLDLIKGEWA